MNRLSLALTVLLSSSVALGATVKLVPGNTYVVDAPQMLDTEGDMRALCDGGVTLNVALASVTNALNGQGPYTLRFRRAHYLLSGDFTLDRRYVLVFEPGAKVEGMGKFTFHNTPQADKYLRLFYVDVMAQWPSLEMQVTNASNAEMSVCWFGATPNNDVTADDDAVGFVAANRASRRMYVPAGAYQINALNKTFNVDVSGGEIFTNYVHLLSNSSIRGDGRKQSVVRINNKDNKGWLVSGLFIGAADDWVTNVTVRDLAFNATHKPVYPGTGMVRPASGWEGSRGLYVYGKRIRDLQIINCEFSSNWHAGLTIWGSLGLEAEDTDDIGPILIRDCLFDANGENGLNANSRRMTIANCVATRNFMGIECDIGTSTVSDCIASMNETTGFGFLGSVANTAKYGNYGVTLSGLVADRNGAEGCAIAGTSRGVVLTGSSFMYNGATASGYAGLIVSEVNEGPEYASGEVLVDGCAFLGNWDKGVYVHAMRGGSRVTIQNCVAGNNPNDYATIYPFLSDGPINLINNRCAGVDTARCYTLGQGAARSTIKSYVPTVYSLTGAQLDEASRTVLLGPGVEAAAGPDARLVASKAGSGSTVSMLNLSEFVVAAPVGALEFRVGTLRGINATKTWWDAGGTNWTVVITGGIITSLTHTP